MTQINYYFDHINYYHKSVSDLLWSPNRLIAQNLIGRAWSAGAPVKKEFLIDNLLVRIHLIIVMI